MVDFLNLGCIQVGQLSRLVSVDTNADNEGEEEEWSETKKQILSLIISQNWQIEERQAASNPW